jgi:hypothetical protein
VDIARRLLRLSGEVGSILRGRIAGIGLVIWAYMTPGWVCSVCCSGAGECIAFVGGVDRYFLQVLIRP